MTIIVVEIFNNFPVFLHWNQITGIEALKEVPLVVRDINCIDLGNEAIKILCTFFPFFP